MSKSTYEVINKTKQSESFGMKARLLDIDTKQQIEMLNKLYKGKVTFRYNEDALDRTQGIVIDSIGRDVISIELPEADDYDMQHLLGYDLFMRESYIDNRGHIVRGSRKSKIVTIKMPKCLPELHISARTSWMNYIERIFVWDTTKLTFDNEHRPSGLGMVAVLSSKGGKAKILKLN